MNISVCLATYNGEKYILEQLDSIIKQLDSDDEIIIVDDCSSDNTVQIIRAINDPRIKLFINDRNRSHVYSFSRAISLATKEIIFMSDQDDKWVNGRVKLMVNKLEKNNGFVISSNSDFMNAEGQAINFQLDGVSEDDSDKHFKNILAIFAGSTNYCGCAMAFKKNINQVILPIPSYVESHDLWIAMAGNLMKANVHINDKTFLRRIHGSNASILQRNLFLKLWSRIVFVVSILVLYKRIIFANSH